MISEDVQVFAFILDCLIRSFYSAVEYYPRFLHILIPYFADVTQHRSRYSVYLLASSNAQWQTNMFGEENQT